MEPETSLGFCREDLAQHRELVQDHTAGLRDRCGETVMQEKTKH